MCSRDRWRRARNRRRWASSLATSQSREKEAVHTTRVKVPPNNNSPIIVTKITPIITMTGALPLRWEVARCPHAAIRIHTHHFSSICRKTGTTPTNQQTIIIIAGNQTASPIASSLVREICLTRHPRHYCTPVDTFCAKRQSVCSWRGAVAI